MTDLRAMLEKATAIGRSALPQNSYGVAYGSHALSTASPNADLDLLYVVDSKIGGDTQLRLSSNVIKLHKQFGLRIDDEVAFEVKLAATGAEITDAAALVPFTQPDGTTLQVPPVLPTPEYLNSQEFKLRLILGALTGPRIFLYGDLVQYRHHTETAMRAISMLSSALLAAKPILTHTDICDTLLMNESGATGKDHLGYQPGIPTEALARTVAWELATLGIVVPAGGGTFDHRRPVSQNFFASPAKPAQRLAQLRLPAQTHPTQHLLVLQPWIASSELVESLLVVRGSGLRLAASAPL